MRIGKAKVSLGLVLFMFLMLVGMATAEDVTEITFWHHEAPAHRVKAIQEVINLFEAENPNIRVYQEVVSWDDAYARTISGIRSKTIPDFQWDIPELNIVANQAGGIIPVTDLVKEIDEQYGYFHSLLAPYYYEGEYWGVPIWTMPHVFLYRPSYLEKYMGTSTPPSTWEEVLEYAEKLTVDTTGDGEPDIFGIGLTAGHNLCTQQQAWSVMSSYGVNVYDSEGNVTFDSEETVKALTMYKKLYEFAPPAASGWAWGEVELNFVAGNIAMFPYFGGIQRRLFEAEDLDLAATLIPLPETGGRETAFSHPNAIHIFKVAEERGTLEAVKDFVRFMMRPDIAAMYTAVQEPGSFLPVTEAAVEAPEYWEDPIISAYEEINQTLVEAVPRSNLYGFEHGHASNLSIGAVSGANLLAEVIQKVVLEGLSPEEAAKWGEAEIKRYAE